MEIKKKRYVHEIVGKMTVLRYFLEASNAGEMYDINREIEDIICRLLNIIYNYKLINLAYYRKNYPGIDLGDTINRVAVQVTSNKKDSKVEHTISLFEKYNYINQYDCLLIVIFGKKENYKGKFDRKPYFKEKSNLIDFNDLCNKIKNCDLKKIEQIYEFINEQLMFSEDETNLLSAIFDKFERSVDIKVGNSFAEKHDNIIALRIEEIYGLISNLKCKYKLSKKEISNINASIKKIRHNTLLVDKYEEDLKLAFKAFMFIKELGTSNLQQLYDFGECIYIQVVEGASQEDVSFFYKHLFFANRELFKEYPLYNKYTFEQLQRIIFSYEQIINFEPNKVTLSSGYVNNISNCNDYLFVSCAGKMNKIYVYNLENLDVKPVAILAGLYEPVRKLKVFRNEDNFLIMALGIRQIYVWNLETGNYKPTYIFRADEGIYYYTMYVALDGKKYVIGRRYNKIFVWALEGNENPIKIVNLDINLYDTLILNTHLIEDSVDYCVLGGTSGDGYSNRNIYELYESDLMNFNVKWISDEKKIFGSDFGILIEYYTMVNCHFLSKTSLLGIITKHTLFLFDIVKKENLLILHQDEQQILGFDSIIENEDIFLVFYYLYRKSQDEGKNLVRCYLLRDKKIVENRDCFQAYTDMKRAVITKHYDEKRIFFNRYCDNIIYYTDYERMSSYKMFVSIPDSMEIIDIING